MFKNKISVFEKIDRYLIKHGHEKIMSLYLDNYNGNNIFIRFDYCKDIMAYKIVWVDLNFFKEKNMGKYINMQLVTSVLANKLDKMLSDLDYQSDAYLNDKIIGDRVEIVNYHHTGTKEYIFDRFLPLEWKNLIDPIVILFSYMPRSMECFLNEMFGKFDGVENKLNALKPYKFDLLKGDLKEIFKPNIIARGTKYYEDDRVVFLEKVEDKYIAIVEGTVNYLVVIRLVDDEYVLMWCNCKYEEYCKHLYATILAIRNKKFNTFYKVVYTGIKDTSLLEKLSNGSYNLCYGVDGDNLLIVGNDLRLLSVPILDHNGKCVFKVIEDDDNKSLSKLISDYNK